MSEKEFFGNGLFDWQISGKSYEQISKERCFNREKYWGDFPVQTEEPLKFPEWAIGPFEKYEGNPVFVPDSNSWDCGHFSGGVHNGSFLFRNGLFYYIYRGESPAPLVESKEVSGDIDVIFDYICDIGVAVSKDGINFRRTTDSSLFRKGENAKYSFEDVCCVENEGTYYLFCNRWDWHNPVNPAHSGVFLATSTDLIHWESRGLVFPDAPRIHRNACVLQDPDNRAVQVGGKFVMYMNDGLIAFSEDMIHWQSEEIDSRWPGGEGCFAVTDYDEKNPDRIVLFTGGHHCGHFYAIGEVLFSKQNVKKPLDYLKRPVLFSETKYPHENGFSFSNPSKRVSSWQDTVFFTGMTRYNGKWMCYYGGSEYYTCLALADFIRDDKKD